MNEGKKNLEEKVPNRKKQGTKDFKKSDLNPCLLSVIHLLCESRINTKNRI